MAYINLRYQSILQCVFTLNNNNLIYYVTTLQGWQSLLPCVRRQLTTHVFPPHMWPQRHDYKAVHTLEISGTIYELVNILQNVATLTSPAVTIRRTSFTQKNSEFSPHILFMCFVCRLQENSHCFLVQLRWLTFPRKVQSVVRNVG